MSNFSGSASTNTNIPQSALGLAIQTEINNHITLTGQNIKCVVPTYNQSDLTNLGIQLDNIVAQSKGFESKQLYHKALVAKDCLNSINCTGADLYFLFNSLVDRIRAWINFYNNASVNQETQLSIDSNLSLNSDYFNN